VAKAAVWTVPVVVLDIGPQDPGKLPAADDEQLVEAFSADRPDPAFGVGVALGARTGVQITWMPVERHTSSNTLVNLLSRSRIRNFHAVV